MNNNAPIGIFDSGIGGLTVVKELVRMLPHEHLIYFGDTARAPYGSRSPGQIVDFMYQILRFLRSREIKMAVYACNTMTALGLRDARRAYSFPCVGMSTGVRPALAATKNKRIGVMATQATIASGSHCQTISEKEPDAVIFPQACPRLVPLIETEITGGLQVEDAVLEYVIPLKNAGIDTLILGCTHYPFLNETINRIVGDGVTVVDPAYDTAVTAYAALRETGVLADEKQQGSVRLYFSADVERAKRMANFLMDIDNFEFNLLNLQDFA